MTEKQERIVVQKNRKRAWGALAIILFMVPVSGWLMILGVQPGRPDVSWALVLFGLTGLIAFSLSAIVVIRTMRAPWHAEIDPSHLALYTPTYNLPIPWDQVSGIAVDAVNQRPGCVLLFEDVTAVVERAQFRGSTRRAGAVTDSATMQSRLKENFDTRGYHLGIPGKILELGPEELAELLVKARTGELWQAEEVQS